MNELFGVREDSLDLGAWRWGKGKGEFEGNDDDGEVGGNGLRVLA